jgi:hypothetical protein
MDTQMITKRWVPIIANPQSCCSSVGGMSFAPWQFTMKNTLTRSLQFFALIALAGCGAADPSLDGADNDFQIDEITCNARIPDRTSSSLSSIPFQRLNREDLPASMASIQWTYPTLSNTMANNFGAGRSYNEGHEGADLGGVRGDVVRSAANGTVVYTLTTCPDNGVRRDTTCGNGWGNHVVVDHGNGVFTRYAHLQRLMVSVGTQVTMAQQVGELGHSGLSDGPHLHFELGTKATAFNPCAAPQNFDRVHNPAKLRYQRAATANAPTPRACRVIQAVSNVRATPNGTILLTLTQGTAMTVKAASGEWYSVSFRANQRDWGTDAQPAFIHRSQVSCQ